MTTETRKHNNWQHYHPTTQQGHSKDGGSLLDSAAAPRSVAGHRHRAPEPTQPLVGRVLCQVQPATAVACCGYNQGEGRYRANTVWLMNTNEMWRIGTTTNFLLSSVLGSTTTRVRCRKLIVWEPAQCQRGQSPARPTLHPRFRISCR